MVGHGAPAHRCSAIWLPQLLLPDSNLLDVRHQQPLGLLLLLRPAAWGLLRLSFYHRFQIGALCPGGNLGGSGEGGEDGM